MTRNINKKNTYFDEMVDPWKGSLGFAIRAEHLMRYVFARDILKKQKQKGVVFDVGCGNGYGSQILSRYLGVVIGFDKKPEFIGGSASLKTENTSFFTYDADFESLQKVVAYNKMPLPGAIVCFEVLEHVKEPGRLLSEFNSLLGDGNLLLISVPNAQFEPKKKGKPRNNFHLHLFDRKKIVSILEEGGFEVMDVYGQHLSNFILHKMKSLNGVLNKVSANLSIFKWLSRVVAYPSRFFITKSYSFIIVAKKL